MTFLPPTKSISLFKQKLSEKKAKYFLAFIVDFCLIVFILILGAEPAKNLVSPLMNPLSPINQSKSTNQVFGFAPYWNIDKLDNVDYKVLTTLSYFGVEVLPDGSLDKDSVGYETFKSSKATSIFKKAHQNGTQVVLTLTQMDNDTIKTILDDTEAKNKTLDQAVSLVSARGIDGINVDFEYSGNPGEEYRNKFSSFVKDLTEKMHAEIPSSKVTVSMYASSVKDPKIYDVRALSEVSDGIFMMAYDFAVAGSDNAIPTAPLNGHQNGKYWYDISTAVTDFLTVMPSNKLILGVPYYGYNYNVSEPIVKAETWGRAASQTYTGLQERLEDSDLEVKTGWDEEGKVGYTAYLSNGNWRMVFMEDTKSLGLKYDFAKDQKLAGVGIWALGNDDGKPELWKLLEDKFGQKQVADSRISQKEVTDVNP